MAIDVAEVRLDAADRIRAEGFLTTVRIPVYVDDKRVDPPTDVQTWVLVENSAPWPLPGDNAAGMDVKLLIAALAWDDEAQQWTDPIELNRSSLVLYNEAWLSVRFPGELAPTGGVLLYECRAMRGFEVRA